MRKRAGFKKVILEDGSVARDTKQEQRWWPDHFASQLGGTAATEDGPRSPEKGPVVSTTCTPPSYEEIADVAAILPKLRATAPSGVPIEAFGSRCLSLSGPSMRTLDLPLESGGWQLRQSMWLPRWRYCSLGEWSQTPKKER